MDAANTMHNEKRLSGALALVMHVLFFILLVFGVSWQKKYEAPVVADLWSSLPPLPQPKIEPPPPEEPAPPEPAPKPVLKPLPKEEPKPIPKPEIAVKKKVEKKEPPKAEPKKHEDDKAAKAKAEEKAKLEKEKQAKEAEAKKRNEEKERELKKFIAEKEANAQAVAQASAQDKLVNEYVQRIQNKIRGLIVEPPNMQGSPEAQFDVVLIPGGEVLTVKLTRSSGVPAYDAAAERAIMKAQPLPLPPDPQLFSRFRELHLKIKPK